MEREVLELLPRHCRGGDHLVVDSTCAEKVWVCYKSIEARWSLCRIILIKIQSVLLQQLQVRLSLTEHQLLLKREAIGFQHIGIASNRCWEIVREKGACSLGELVFGLEERWLREKIYFVLWALLQLLLISTHTLITYLLLMFELLNHGWGSGVIYHQFELVFIALILEVVSVVESFLSLMVHVAVWHILDILVLFDQGLPYPL